MRVFQAVFAVEEIVSVPDAAVSAEEAKVEALSRITEKYGPGFNVKEFVEIDANGKRLFDVYLFSQDETATLMEYSIAVSPLVEELSVEMLREIFIDLYTTNTEYKENNEDEKEDPSTWSKEKVVQAIWDVHGLHFDSVAFIDQSHSETIAAVGEAMSEAMQDQSDGGTYAICNSFGVFLYKLAERTIDFPKMDCELFYEDMV